MASLTLDVRLGMDGSTAKASQVMSVMHDRNTLDFEGIVIIVRDDHISNDMT